MAELLECAIAKLKTLPDNEQDTIAAIRTSHGTTGRIKSAVRRQTQPLPCDGVPVSSILEELEDEMQWNEAFARSHDTLAKLAAEAMSEHRAGKTQELNPDKL